MFAQSFKYISSLVLTHFRAVPPKPGERFHLHVEKKEEVEELYSALCKSASYNFTCGKYTSRSIKIEGGQLMIASSHNASESFLTRLRNNTASQEKSFKGVALLTIHDTSLDSIVNGSQGLNKEGAPLHISVFKKKLKEDLGQLNVHPSEKIALQIKLSLFNSNVHEDSNAILAYYPFMNILQNNAISSSDWVELGLFHDPEVVTINNQKDLKSRLIDNQNLFELVQNTHKYGDPSEDLVKHFIHAGIKELKEPTWRALSYGQVKKWKEDRAKASPPEYQEQNSLFPLDGIEYWDRAEGTTAAAQRKRHIIIFNKEQHDEVKHTLVFDKVLKQSAIKIGNKCLFSVDVQSKQIKVTIPGCGQEAKIGSIVYDDENASGKYLFNIAVLPFSSKIISNYSSTYLVRGIGKKHSLRFNSEHILVFNENGETEDRVRLEEDSLLNLNDETKLIVEIPEDYESDLLKFGVVWEGVHIPCDLITEATKPVSVSGLNIWKQKREQKRSFYYANDNKLIFGNEEFFTNRQRTLQYLDIEKQIISEYSNYCFWHQDKNGIAPYHLDIDPEVQKAFSDITNYYKKRRLLPSLTSTYETELLGLMRVYIERFSNVLSNLTEGQPLKKQFHNLLKVGTVERHQGQHHICLTPLHPLNVAYQLHAHEALQDEVIPSEILSCLSPNDLLPYINGSTNHNDKFCPVKETELVEWSIYRPFRTIHRGWHNEYVHKLIAEKITEYVSHFPYLFTGSSEAPIKVNIINLGDGVDALNGIVKYFQKAINDAKGDISKIHPLTIRIYDEQTGINKFEEFASYNSPSKIEQDFEVDLGSRFIDKYDVLKVIREKLDFYILPKDQEPKYAHLTFMKFEQNSIGWTYHDMSSVKTGCSLQGLVNAVPSVFAEDEYITGFGAKHLSSSSINCDLASFAILYNSFARVANTQDPYSANESTFATLHSDEKKRLNAIYEKSNWVTFIDPKVDLNFFKSQKESKDLIIIHYSDQYNNTSGYDAITVTRKSKQYRSIIQDYLLSRGVDSSVDEELKLISMFNAINGDWLLRLISSKRGHFSREKISILSAVNTMLAILSHPEIVWLPLSLEEILRVSGGAGLKKSEGLFSAKNLGSIGSHCDDLLMAGVELKDGIVKIYLYPVEVKIGADQTQKAKEQGVHTAKVLKEHLMESSFKAAFYRNFFAKLMIVAAEKLSLYEIYEASEVELITETCRDKLLNDEMFFSWDLEKYIGRSGVISFKNGQFSRKVTLDDDCLIVEMLEGDGSENMLKQPHELHDIYDSIASSVDRNLLLKNSYSSDNDILEMGDGADVEDIKVPEESVLEEDDFGQPDTDTPIEQDDGESIEIEQHDQQPGMKVLFGHEMNNGEPVYWEPNDTNKVMHTNTGIIGTMGTGKTQFTKSLVTQLVWQSKNNVNNTKLGFLIFDYKGDYIKEDFINATNAKRFELHHLPFNPLALTVGDSVQPMLPLHTANAIKESISTAFGLGVVQKQKLRDCIMAAYSSFGIDKADSNTWTRNAPTISNVCEEYLNSEDVKPDSLYAALDNLNQFEIFEPNPEKTISLWDLLDDVVVINLAGYDQDIQNLVVAITLDQFYSQMQKAGHSKIHGDYREITKMVLVDEADNFLSQNFQAIRKILKEGREFGVGTILSTQFLDHFSTSDNDFANYILTWVAHRVAEINKKGVMTMFGNISNDMVTQISSEVSCLEKHKSICNLGNGTPIMLTDRAFWQIIK